MSRTSDKSVCDDDDEDDNGTCDCKLQTCESVGEVVAPTSRSKCRNARKRTANAAFSTTVDTSSATNVCKDVSEHEDDPLIGDPDADADADGDAGSAGAGAGGAAENVKVDDVSHPSSSSKSREKVKVRRAKKQKVNEILFEIILMFFLNVSSCFFFYRC